MDDEIDVALVVDAAPRTLRCSPLASLLTALRDAGLTATPGGCEQGECGSCTVVLDGRTVCSCLVLAASTAGGEVRTVTSMLRADLAEAVARHGGVQCGFCTPGFVVSAAALLEERRDRPPTRDELREALAGNLCRCTGYEALLDAVAELAGP